MTTALFCWQSALHSIPNVQPKTHVISMEEAEKLPSSHVVYSSPSRLVEMMGKVVKTCESRVITNLWQPSLPTGKGDVWGMDVGPKRLVFRNRGFTLYECNPGDDIASIAEVVHSMVQRVIAVKSANRKSEIGNRKSEIGNHPCSLDWSKK